MHKKNFKMKAFFLLIFFCLPAITVATEDDGSILKIISPKNATVVGKEVEVKYELQKGTQADHVHAFVDGEYQKGFKGTLTGLTPGKHEITLKVANSDHDLLAISETIVIEVK
ncbi:MAG: hypothetical protein NPINA01_11030 [Nitrospinaceae bacterium]|nr:MAG: hypothetical protein NPINA01_11030 [Nitrospinaceae bacterium]